MRRTPWTKPASSFASDRIKPAQVSSSDKNKNNKGTTKLKDSPGSSSRTDAESGKSGEVRRLEGLLQALRTASGLEKDPKGGCYCLARIHDLSPYNPICRSCGLILCSLNQPNYCCPSCHKPILSTTTTTTTTATSTSPARETIITQLEFQLATTISQEAEHRQRALDEARKAAGAFPALSSSSSSMVGTHSEHHQHHHHHPSQPYPIPAVQTHKILSLTENTKSNNKSKNKNKRQTVTVSTYTSRQPSRSGSVTPSVNVEEEPTRVGLPKPPPITAKRPERNRPFENFLHGSVTYKPCTT